MLGSVAYFGCQEVHHVCRCSDVLCHAHFTGVHQQVGHPTVWRPNTDVVQKAIFITDPSQAATSRGLVVAWDVYFNADRLNYQIFLQIWRPVVDATKHIYILIGQTRVVALWKGHVHFQLQPDDWIQANAGDVIAISFLRYNR